MQFESKLQSVDKIYLDARSYAQLLYMLALIEHYGFLNKCTLVTSNKYVNLDFIPTSIALPKESLRFDYGISDTSLSFKYKLLAAIRKKIRSHLGKSSALLITGYNYGLYFETIKRGLNINSDDIVLVNDGIGNDVIIKNKVLYKTLFYLVNGYLRFVTKERLNRDISLCFFATISKTQVASAKCCVIRIGKIVSDYYMHLAIKEPELIRVNKSALLLSHHAVENGRMSLAAYKYKIKQVVSVLKEKGFTDIYLSKHHTETDINNNLYDELKLIYLDNRLPAEFQMVRYKFKAVAHPFNSCVVVLNALDFLKNVDLVISYEVSNSPYIKERKFEIQKILDDSGISNLVINE